MQISDLNNSISNNVGNKKVKFGKDALPIFPDLKSSDLLKKLNAQLISKYYNNNYYAIVFKQTYNEILL